MARARCATYVYTILEPGSDNVNGRPLTQQLWVRWRNKHTFNNPDLSIVVTSVSAFRDKLYFERLFVVEQVESISFWIGVRRLSSTAASFSKQPSLQHPHVRPVERVLHPGHGDDAGQNRGEGDESDCSRNELEDAGYDIPPVSDVNTTKPSAPSLQNSRQDKGRNPVAKKKYAYRG